MLNSNRTIGCHRNYLCDARWGPSTLKDMRLRHTPAAQNESWKAPRDIVISVCHSMSQKRERGVPRYHVALI